MTRRAAWRLYALAALALTVSCERHQGKMRYALHAGLTRKEQALVGGADTIDVVALFWDRSDCDLVLKAWQEDGRALWCETLGR